ncbi:hypothetical protein SCG7086_AA_00640 [Chlamydiales bacterium SCGC AG-110-P3]|nr:hypothetical protein SCG7086_AA_00640 [Chlamydiales bacterium SCGC AG-110-P3]
MTLCHSDVVSIVNQDLNYMSLKWSLMLSINKYLRTGYQVVFLKDFFIHLFLLTVEEKIWLKRY